MRRVERRALVEPDVAHDDRTLGERELVVVDEGVRREDVAVRVEREVQQRGLRRDTGEHLAVAVGLALEEDTTRRARRVARAAATPARRCRRRARADAAATRDATPSSASISTSGRSRPSTKPNQPMACGSTRKRTKSAPRRRVERAAVALLRRERAPRALAERAHACRTCRRPRTTQRATPSEEVDPASRHQRGRDEELELGGGLWKTRDERRHDAGPSPTASWSRARSTRPSPRGASAGTSARKRRRRADGDPCTTRSRRRRAGTARRRVRGRRR